MKGRREIMFTRAGSKRKFKGNQKLNYAKIKI